MTPYTARSRRSSLARLVSISLLASLALGTGAAVAAPPVPFTVSPSSLSLSAVAGAYDYETVTVQTAKKAVVLENPATLSSSGPFFDTQAGTCWQSYGSVGAKIPANTSCTIQVGFHPTAAGSSSGTMTIYSCQRSHVSGGQMVCDARDGSRTVSLAGSATAVTCSYTPGTTGCIVLTNVSMTDSPSTATYVVSGDISFTPTCDIDVDGCSFAYPNVVISGSGTFSVSGSQTASGTWAIPAPPNDHPEPNAYQFSDASYVNTTCADAVIRQVTFNFPLVASNGDTGGGWLTVRTDDAGTSDVVGGQFMYGTLPAGLFRNAVDSQAGVTVSC